MSNQKVNHSEQRIFNATATKSATTTGNWFDVNGQVKKVLTVDVDDTGTADLDIIMHISNQGYYELNNKTATTEDYEATTVVSSLATETQVRYTSDDVDELDEPIRSIRISIVNNNGATDSTVLVDIGGQS